MSHTLINTICPIEYADKARNFAFKYLLEQQPGLTDTVDKMLPVLLGPEGNSTVTHIFCNRIAHFIEVDSQVEFIARQKLPWCSDRAFNNQDDPDLIKSKFCTFVGTEDDFLSYLKLVKK